MKQDLHNNSENLNQDSSTAKWTKKRFFTRGRIIVLSIISAVILLGIWDIFIDPPAWWRFERQQDKRAILAYVEEKYPNAKSKGSKFPFQRMVGPYPASIMYFELDGVNFHVAAKRGSVISDGYSQARACAQFDKIIQDGFLKPMGKEANTHYRFVDDYDIYPYTGSLVVCLTIRDQGSTPKEVGWLYDFYKYWKNEGDFLKSYSARIDIVVNDEIVYHINYNNSSEFPNEDSFYAAFETGH